MRPFVVLLSALLLGACAYSSPAPDGYLGSGYGAGYGYGGGMPWASPYGSGYGNAGERFSPKKGITCERDRRLCYDRYGIDYYATHRYLGSKAAKHVVNKYGDQIYLFTPKQGVICDRRSQSCSRH